MFDAFCASFFQITRIHKNIHNQSQCILSRLYSNDAAALVHFYEKLGANYNGLTGVRCTTNVADIPGLFEKTPDVFQKNLSFSEYCCFHITKSEAKTSCFYVRYGVCGNQAMLQSESSPFLSHVPDLLDTPCTVIVSKNCRPAL